MNSSHGYLKDKKWQRKQITTLETHKAHCLED